MTDRRLFAFDQNVDGAVVVVRSLGAELTFISGVVRCVCIAVHLVAVFGADLMGLRDLVNQAGGLRGGKNEQREQ